MNQFEGLILYWLLHVIPSHVNSPIRLRDIETFVPVEFRIIPNTGEFGVACENETV